MSRIRNADWEADSALKVDLQNYVLKNLKREEVLDFVRRDFPQYAWSLGTLSRRLKYFDIHYVDYVISVEDIDAAFRQEQDGPGQLLGYRAVHKVIREKHKLAVPRGLVYDVMANVDPDGLDRRRMEMRKRPRGPRGTFTSMVSKLLPMTVLKTLMYCTVEGIKLSIKLGYILGWGLFFRWV